MGRLFQLSGFHVLPMCYGILCYRIRVGGCRWELPMRTMSSLRADAPEISLTTDLMFSRCMTDETSDVEQSVVSTPVSNPPATANFGEFYDREFTGQVHRATLLIGSIETAHDVVHDAFVHVFKRWDSIAQPGAYLNRAVLNGCRDLARRRAVASNAVLHFVPPEVDEHDPLWDALRHLPFNHRAAVVLRYYHQLSENEIAAQLGCRPGSVEPWIQRGLRTLRKELS